MPKFNVVCSRLTSSRVVLEVSARSEREAKALVEGSRDPCAEFEEVGDFDEGDSDLTVWSVAKAQDKAG